MGGVPPANLPDLPIAGQAAALVVRRLLEHTHELDAADLTVDGGDVVAVVSVAEVRDWLASLAGRAESGERL